MYLHKLSNKYHCGFVMYSNMYREEVKNKLREAIQEFLQNDKDNEPLERIPIDNLKQV